MIKEFLYKTIFVYYRYAFKKKKGYEPEGMAVALLSSVLIAYIFPFFILLYVFIEPSRNKILFYVSIGIFSLVNYILVSKYFSKNIDKAKEYVEGITDVKKYEEYIIILLSFLSAPFFVAILLFFRVINLVWLLWIMLIT